MAGDRHGDYGGVVMSDNGEKKVLDALEEVLNQTYPNSKQHAVFAGIIMRSLEKRGFVIVPIIWEPER